MNFQTCIAVTVVTSVLLLACILAMIRTLLKLKEMNRSIAGIARTNIVYYGSTCNELKNLDAKVESRVTELKSELLYLSNELTQRLCSTVHDVQSSQTQDMSDENDKVDETMHRSDVHADMQEHSKRYTEVQEKIPEVIKKDVVASLKTNSGQTQDFIVHADVHNLPKELADVVPSLSKGNVGSNLNSVELHHVNSRTIDVTK